MDTSSPLPTAGLSSLRDLNDLEVFARVVERNGFSRAAHELNVPPSTVSRRVSRLEERLGVRLLQRTTRTIHLTEAGRVYFESISQALREIENAETSLRNVAGQPRGRVRMTTVSEPFLESVLFDFLQEYPEVQLDLDKSHERVDLVAEGFDLAVRAGSLPDSSLVAHRLDSSKARLLAAPTYLEKNGTPRSASDLRDHDCVLLGSSSASGVWMLGGPNGPLRTNVKGRIAVNNYYSCIEATRRGFGIGLLAGHFPEVLMARGELLEVLAELAPEPVDMWIVYPSRTLQTPAVRALIEFIRRAFQERTPSELPPTLGFLRP